MRFKEIDVPGMYLIELDVLTDERGFFCRTFDREQFEELGLAADVVQTSVSRTTRRGTVRGLHYQVDPSPEAKLVRCTRGALFDVVVDLRPGSPMRCQPFTMELRADDGRMLYIPKYCAHGFQTLEDDTEIQYQMDVAYAPATARILHHADPQLAIPWPLPVTAVSERDRLAPTLAEIEDPLS